MPNIIQKVTIEEVEHFCYLSASDMFKNSEHLPAFDSRYKGVLESCLNQPFQSINGSELYPFIYKKASILFYLCIKNHPFLDGNKRIAVFILLLFLHKNKLNLMATDEDIYNIAVNVAKSETKKNEETIKNIEDFLLKRLIF